MTALFDTVDVDDDDDDDCGTDDEDDDDDAFVIESSNMNGSVANDSDLQSEYRIESTRGWMTLCVDNASLTQHTTFAPFVVVHAQLQRERLHNIATCCSSFRKQRENKYHRFVAITTTCFSFPVSRPLSHGYRCCGRRDARPILSGPRRPAVLRRYIKRNENKHILHSTQRK